MTRKVSLRFGTIRADLRRIPFDFVINSLIASRFIPVFLRFGCYRAMGFDVARCRIYDGVYIGSRKLVIGQQVFINRECFFEAGAPILLGSRVSIGMRTVFCTGTHDIGTPVRRAGTLHHRGITVGDGAWIGTNVTVLPGVTIGMGCVIGAGALVTKDCEPNGLYLGIPATLVRILDAEDRDVHVEVS